ncbi:putative methyltransferase [Maioricimonas rarisocia]|uniref:Putative methyltransferase n=1 Tax=Maioricimonas rarisocia TaxID=2528026 RepID=A0A517Z1N1_9PLAN|nr:class I SAM-dependent methyltransferase [Maioricimonas rarisocia]QDU36392.1 putative methyltransferase [Maioricimonas rarisocia]
MPLPDELHHGRRFDEYAAGYDAPENVCRVRQAVREKAAELIGDRCPLAVIDVGCGTGSLLCEVAPTIQAGIGLDVSREMLAVAGQKAIAAGRTNLEFRFGSFTDLSSPEFRSDLPEAEVVVSTYAMHHLPADEKRRTLEAMTTLLVPGGAIVLGDLMFFDPPEEHRESFDEAGYGPEHDQPETVETLQQWAEELECSAELYRIHPLAGVVEMEKA